MTNAVVASRLRSVFMVTGRKCTIKLDFQEMCGSRRFSFAIRRDRNIDEYQGTQSFICGAETLRARRCEARGWIL